MPETSPLHARLSGPFGRWVGGVSRRPVLVVLLCLAVSVGLAWLAAVTLTINTSTDDMLSKELPFRAQNEAVDAAFPQLVDTLTIALDAPDALAAEAAAGRLAAALAAQPAVAQSVFLPQGGPFFRQNGLLYLSAVELQALGDRLAGAQPLLAALQADPSLRGLADLLELAVTEGTDGGGADLARFLDRLAEVAVALQEDPGARLSWSALLSDGGETAEDRRRFVVVKPVIDFGSLAPLAGVVAAIERAASDLGLTGENGYRLRVTGEPLMLQDELESVKSGIGVVGLISTLLVALVLFGGLRSWRLAVPILVTLVAGLTWTAGFAALAVGELNIISVAFAVLFIGLSVDFGIHFSLRAQESRIGGLAPPAALVEAAGITGGPLLLCAVTSALAFFSFFPTAYRGLSELGLIAGAGMVIALFLNLTLLPALLRLLPAPPGAAHL
ncbi:MAG TPA: MMPL family transporter, partial [Kiloniellaceae bacterium]